MSIEKLDSDNNIEVTGSVRSLERDTTFSNSKKLIINLEGDRSYRLDLPINTTGLDLMLYSQIMTGERINYSKIYKPWEEGMHITWTVEFLSGKLQGNKFKQERA